MISTATWLRPGGRLWAALALAAAAAGEALVRTGRPWGLGAALYVLAALLFAPAAWPQPAPREAPLAAEARGGGMLAAGAVLALLLGAASVFTYFRREEGATLRLWIAGAVVLAATSLLAGRRLDVPERWGIARLPSLRRARILAALGLAALFAAAAFLRLWNLAKVPWGVNPDEGDQAALAIQIARGFNANGPFGFGWYHISMVYYKILAAVMSVASLDVAGARVFGALCGLATVALVVVVGIRHFGWRAGLLAGVLVTAMGGALQFSRITTVAAPTATLWALSAAAFLEAARSGRALFWALAGLSGGFSIFFYPTGRLWCVLAVPFALGGVMWMLFLSQTHVSVPALMGTLMCIGLTTANSILVVVFANQRMALGVNPRGAAIEAGFTRLRPVLMTAGAMILGMIPMALGVGEGGEQNAPLARAVIGGLLFATVATLVFVPTMYALLRRAPSEARAPAARELPARGS